MVGRMFNGIRAWTHVKALAVNDSRGIDSTASTRTSASVFPILTIIGPPKRNGWQSVVPYQPFTLAMMSSVSR
jgi:hypothetical protein